MQYVQSRGRTIDTNQPTTYMLACVHTCTWIRLPPRPTRRTSSASLYRSHAATDGSSSRSSSSRGSSPSPGGVLPNARCRRRPDRGDLRRPTGAMPRSIGPVWCGVVTAGQGGSVQSVGPIERGAAAAGCMQLIAEASLSVGSSKPLAASERWVLGPSRWRRNPSSNRFWDRFGLAGGPKQALAALFDRVRCLLDHRHRSKADEQIERRGRGAFAPSMLRGGIIRKTRRRPPARMQHVRICLFPRGGAEPPAGPTLPVLDRHRTESSMLSTKSLSKPNLTWSVGSNLAARCV